ncbi:hypothetical protein E2C01_089533 [Portunus trituberculatus]|uniref:Uncharacterized protein n=1 Tax=Portunus trituberculatus TaxID=210409 RepID=A0A5B7JJ98_PORTR|nr:hypothetical protein [Portunus trituberculatus]
MGGGHNNRNEGTKSTETKRK